MCRPRILVRVVSKTCYICYNTLSIYTPSPSLVVQLDLHALVVHEIHAPPNWSDETRPFEVNPAATEKGRTFEQIVSCLTFDLDQMSSQAEQRLTCKRPCRPSSNESPSIPFLLPRSVEPVRLLPLCHPRLLGTTTPINPSHSHHVSHLTHHMNAKR
jgi:hypothetical protein